MNLVRILILLFLVFMALKQKNHVTKDMLLILTGLLAVCMVDQEGYEEAKSIQLNNWGVNDNDLGLNDDDKKKTQAGDGRDIFDFSGLPDSAGPATDNDMAGYFKDSVLHLEPGKTDGISCTDENNISGVVEWRIGMDSLKNTITYSDYFRSYPPGSTDLMPITLGPAEVAQETSTPNKDKIDTLFACKISDEFKCPRDILAGGDVISNESLPTEIVTNPLNTCNEFMYPIDGTQPVSGSPSPDIKNIKISDGCKIYNVNEWSDFHNNCCVSLTPTGNGIILPPSVCESPPSGPNYCNYKSWWVFDICIVLISVLAWRVKIIATIGFLTVIVDICQFIYYTSYYEIDCYKPRSLYHLFVELVLNTGVNEEWVVVTIIYSLLTIILIILLKIKNTKKADEGLMETLVRTGGVPSGNPELRATRIVNSNQNRAS